MSNKEIDELRSDLAAEGYTVTRSGGGHYRVTRPDLPGAKAVIIPATPSGGRRGMQNTLADLRRNLGYERGRPMKARKYPRPGVVHRAFIAAGPRGLTVPQFVNELPARHRHGQDHADLVTWASGVIRAHVDLYLEGGKERRPGSGYKSTVWRWRGPAPEPAPEPEEPRLALVPAVPEGAPDGHEADLTTIVDMVLALPMSVLEQEGARAQLKRLAPIVDAARNY